jgi:lantibiotic modifying enzyme
MSDKISAAVSRRTAIAQAAAAALTVALPTGQSAQRNRPGTRMARPYRDAALRAAHWIAQSAQRDARGLRWPADPLKPDGVSTELYSGTSGVVLFHLELFAATGDRAHLATAVSGANHLLATMPADSNALGDEGAGLYTGLAGHVYVLERVGTLAAEPRLRDGAARAMSMLHAVERARATRGTWNASNDIISGTAGIGLTMLWAHQALGDTEALACAVRAGQQLLAAGQPQPTGTKWEVQPGFARRYPNFSHGTAGVAFFLARLFEVTRTQAFLDGAIAGAQYLQALAVTTSGGGRKIMHSEPGGEQLYYMSWCHGPAGTARLFHQLGTVTNDRRWHDYVPSLAQGIVDSGVPQTHPDRSGFWNNISQCCGSCGVSEFFLAAHRVTSDPRHLAFATTVMDDTLARATADGPGLKWIQAENRPSPDVVVAQTGLMQGAAGVGLALLHLDGAINGRRAAITLPDTPAW